MKFLKIVLNVIGVLIGLAIIGLVAWGGVELCKLFGFIK